MARFVVLVIDSLGADATKDVTWVRSQDAGVSTCGHILGELPQLRLPTLEKLGLINTLGFVPGTMKLSISAVWGVAELQHEGGDTSMGHQKILGTRPQVPPRTPSSNVIGGVEQALKVMGRHVKRRGDGLASLWANDAVAVGDNLKVDLGQVHNVTTNFAVVLFDEALKIDRMVREQAQVGCVVAFGDQPIDSQRIPDVTETKEGRFIGINAPRSNAYENGLQVGRMGFGVDEQVQVLQRLYDAGILAVLVGKVADIVDNLYGRSQRNLVDGQQIMDITPNEFDVESVVFTRINIQGTDLIRYAEDMERYAERLQFVSLSPPHPSVAVGLSGCLVVMVDYNSNPTTSYSHYTREVVPVLVYQQGLAPA